MLVIVFLWSLYIIIICMQVILELYKYVVICKRFNKKLCDILRTFFASTI